MSEPITFSSSSTRFELPMLFAAQAQKEVFVNEALLRLDGLLHPAVEGEADTPPLTPLDGESWIIGSNSTDDWADHAGELALRQAGNWLFATPSHGMIVFDKTAGQFARFDGQWQRAASVSTPAGGNTVDTEARQAITTITEALIAAGILPSS